ncbi:peptidoglycan-binding protein [Streptomyces sp. CHD11]|uniref:peptidoglycan-binding domain-containing protein n=1 Tax=Streptomyces sp. CHD11 TaxID=2741325 RepID=UPI001BFCBAFE|nr:peptidoglycan-binding domain-containing protein [Streptomyces sp. CHD11]MBT3151501.1 peptidoglycan-binding protein [Streptomyces sp. CHD11]
MRLRAFATAAAVAVSTLGFTGVTAPTASAATTCSGYSDYYDGSFRHYYISTTSNGSKNRNCVLSQGNQGTGVKWLQYTLNVCYDQGLAADGIFGPATRTAVRNVQSYLKRTKNSAVVVDGVFGPQTSKHMSWGYYTDNGGWMHC